MSMQRLRALLFISCFNLFAYGADGTKKPEADSLSPSCRTLVATFPIALPSFVWAELADQTLYLPVGRTEGPVPGWIEQHLSGGKHLRPMMAFLTAGALGTEVQKIRGLTRLLELIHLGSLALDDIIDGATERRDRKPVYIAEGFVGGVITGPWLQAHVFREAATLTSIPVQIEMADTLMAMGNGEILQNELKQRGKAEGTYSEAEYFHVARGKTGVLFGLSFEIVPLHLGLERGLSQKWNLLGQGIGIAYQIKDDFEDAEKEGREINYALLKAAQHFGGSPFRAVTKAELETLRQAEMGNMSERRQSLNELVNDIERDLPLPLSETQRASFETIRDIITYVTAI